jgi:hypothetical protein
VGRRQPEPNSFADLVHQAKSESPSPKPAVETWPQPIEDGRWVDDSGVEWRIRGPRIDPAGSALRRLLKRTELRVLHAYGPRPREVSGPDRQALLEAVERYVAGEAPPHSAFWMAEFRNDDHQVMLVIEEAC